MVTAHNLKAILRNNLMLVNSTVLVGIEGALMVLLDCLTAKTMLTVLVVIDSVMMVMLSA
jgi:hypothetical protein